MKILKYQKIQAEFKPWREVYLEVANKLVEHIQTADIEVLHFGSSSAKVGGKGIIDLSILYKSDQTDLAVKHLKCLGFQDQASSKPFPASRPRKDGAVMYQGEQYLIHAHVIEKHSQEHKNQIAYKQYLLANPNARKEYEQAKQAILAQGISEQEAYGDLKSPFVKSILSYF